MEIRYNELDENMISLVKALNSFEGCYTIGSCGGHKNPTEIQQPYGKFFVSFRLSLSNVNGRQTLQYLTWLIGTIARHGMSLDVSLVPHANAPLGRASVWWSIDGTGYDTPDKVANILNQRDEFLRQYKQAIEEWHSEAR